MYSEQDQQSNHCHQRLDWMCSKTNWACSEFRAGFWTKTLFNDPHCISSCKLLSRLLQNLTGQRKNSPYLKKGYQKLLYEIWVILVLFKHRKIKTFETRHSFGHWVQPISFYITIKWKGKGRQSCSSSLYSKKQWAQTSASCYRATVN